MASPKATSLPDGNSLCEFDWSGSSEKLESLRFAIHETINR